MVQGGVLWLPLVCCAARLAILHNFLNGESLADSDIETHIDRERTSLSDFLTQHQVAVPSNFQPCQDLPADNRLARWWQRHVTTEAPAIARTSHCVEQVPTTWQGRVDSVTLPAGLACVNTHRISVTCFRSTSNDSPNTHFLNNCGQPLMFAHAEEGPLLAAMTATIVISTEK
ncbi:hypothetical protein EK21DRAFT_91459 [Setomelanomma holmii]|uniref:Secreted protein n=1 Tax=Setomelanomma holmii TaxID=210430 RepID=A0A9P4H5W3_9PLEO|nr:hypothetical protein EK21DRAFT_91459 [Setomelanomma holmii]